MVDLNKPLTEMTDDEVMEFLTHVNTEKVALAALRSQSQRSQSQRSKGTPRPRRPSSSPSPSPSPELDMLLTMLNGGPLDAGPLDDDPDDPLFEVIKKGPRK